jgi:acetyl esterase
MLIASAAVRLLHSLIVASVLHAAGNLAAAEKQAGKKGGGKKAPASKLASVEIKTDERLYKQTPQGELKLHFFFPPGWKSSDKRPAIIFFFGGGWKNGSYTQFVPQAEYFASRGLVAASADYRIESIHKTTPDKCVEDAKSAMRWLRAKAGELGIDPDKIIASGGSAGGHLAAATALIDKFDAEGDPKISAKPNAMVLFNPALNIDELAEARNATAEEKARARDITPNRFIKSGTPPCIMFFGTEDKLKEGAVQYLAKAKPLGLHAELWAAADMPHGFFNRSPWTEVTAKKSDEFLAALGYLTGEPTIKLPENAPSLKRQD